MVLHWLKCRWSLVFLLATTTLVFTSCAQRVLRNPDSAGSILSESDSPFLSVPIEGIQVVPDQLYTGTLLHVLGKAQRTIDALQFSFAITDNSSNLQRDSEPFQIAERLISLKAANPRLQIRLYIEGERDTAKRNLETGAFLEKNGITVKYGSTHAKGFAVDGKTILLGSTNLTTQSMRHNNETNILLADAPEIARDFTSYFERLWSGEERISGIVPASPVNGVQLVMDGEYKNQLLTAIGAATKTVDFSIYYFNESDIENALIAAQKRGVKVRGYINQHRSFALELVERNKATLKRLQVAGLTEVYLDLDHFFSHSKYLIADSETLILGTGNWNRSDVETHPQLYLKIKNADIADRLSRHLSHQIAYESDRPSTKPYYRFWVGYKRSELGLEEFDQVIRDSFVRATIKTGAGGGLIGYLPALVAKPPASSYPDEVAMIIYQDEPTYRAIRESAVGSVYGPLHFDYFDKVSKSFVPESFLGTAKEGAAYDLSQPGVDWQTGKSLFVYSPKSPAADATDRVGALSKYFAYIKANLPSLGLKGYVALVGSDFLIEYLGRTTPWTERLWQRLNGERAPLLGDTHLSPSHVEVAPSRTFADNEIKRPAEVPYQFLQEGSEPGVVAVKFASELRPKDFLDESLVSFTRSKEQTEKLKNAIKDAFVNNRPVPTRD